MAHFAKLENNIVTEVIVVSNNELLNTQGIEEEALGIQFCTNLLGGEWKQTSYNGTFRKNYAGIGFRYDADLDAFIPPQPYLSWTLDIETCQWQPPVPYPTEDARFIWDEQSLSWVVVG